MFTLDGYAKCAVCAKPRLTPEQEGSWFAIFDVEDDDASRAEWIEAWNKLCKCNLCPCKCHMAPPPSSCASCTTERCEGQEWAA